MIGKNNSVCSRQFAVSKLFSSHFPKGTSKLQFNLFPQIFPILILSFNLSAQTSPEQLLESAILQLETSNFDSSETLTKQVLQLADNQQTIADCYNNLGRIEMRRDQFQNAIDWHGKSLKIREQIFGNNHPKAAASFENLGNCFLRLGDFQNAISFHNKALKIRQNLKNEEPLDFAKSLNNLGNTYYMMQDLGAAFQYFSMALQVRQQVLPPDDVQIARTIMNIGNLYFSNGTYEEALLNYEEALNIFQSNYEKGNSDVADVFFNIGNTFLGKKNYSEAIKNYENALHIQLEIYGANSLKIANIYQNIGNAFSEKGDFVQALQYFENAKSIRSQLLPAGHPDLADSFEAIGLNFLKEGDAQKALVEQQKVLTIRQQYFNEKSRAVGGTYSNLGNIFLETEQPDSAIFYYQKAEKALSQNPILLAKNYNNIGSAFFEKAMRRNLLSGTYMVSDNSKKDFEKALNYFEKAINTSSNYGIDNPNYWKNAGIVLTKLGKNEMADLRFQTALNLLEFTENEDFTNYDRLSELIEILGARANLFFQNHKKDAQKDWLEKSISTYELAINLMEKLRFSFSEAGSQQKILENNFQIFEGLIESYFYQFRQTKNSDWLEKAFAISEKSKSLILLEALRKSNAEKFGGIPDSLLQKEENLKTDIAFFEQQKREALQYGDTETAQLMTQKIFESKQNQRVLIHQFEQDFPQYFQLKYETSALSISEIQNEIIVEEQAIIEYFIGQQSIFIFIITKNEFQGFVIGKDFPLQEWVSKLRRSLFFYPNTGGSEAESLNDQYLETAHQLFQKIIPDYDLPERLIIIPDGSLNFLPFEVLLTKTPERKIRFKTHPYLLQKHQISYAYSTTLLKEMQKKVEQKAPKLLAAFAPDFENNSHNLGILKHNKTEVEIIGDIISGDNFYSENANLQQFLKIAKDYKILHLATHGKANAKAGEYSYLAFTEIADSLASLLYVKDLYIQKLVADLVVLSACETGIGEYQAGEGIVSLARGFSYAGAKSIVTSLWSVNDAATAELMELFYKKLEEGLSKDVALQKAKLEFLDSRPHDEAHPFYWACFIPIGEMSAVDSGGFGIWFWMGVAGLFLLAFLFLYKKRSSGIPA